MVKDPFIRAPDVERDNLHSKGEARGEGDPTPRQELETTEQHRPKESLQPQRLTPECPAEPET